MRHEDQNSRWHKILSLSAWKRLLGRWLHRLAYPVRFVAGTTKIECRLVGIQSQLERNRFEMQAQLERNRSEMQAQLEHNRSEMQAQLERNRSEMQAQLERNRSEMQAQLEHNCEKDYQKRLLHDFPHLNEVNAYNLYRKGMCIEMPFVSVFGCSCSGTTIMGKLLDSHPSVFSMSSPECPLPKHLQRKSPLAPSFESYCFSIFFKSDHLDSPRTDVEILAYLKEIESLAKLKNKTCIAEKTPYHLLHTHRMNELVPNIRFVCMVRDGRDNIASLSQTTICEDPLYKHKPHDDIFEQSINFYVQYMDRIVELEKKHANMIIVRLEDLTSDPQKTLNRVFSFCGLTTNDYILGQILDTRNTRPENLSVRTGDDRDNRAVRNFQRVAPLAKNTTRWKMDLSQKQLDRVMERIQPYLEHFGYLDTGTVKLDSNDTEQDSISKKTA